MAWNRLVKKGRGRLPREENFSPLDVAARLPGPPQPESSTIPSAKQRLSSRHSAAILAVRTENLIFSGNFGHWLMLSAHLIDNSLVIRRLLEISNTLIKELETSRLRFPEIESEFHTQLSYFRWWFSYLFCSQATICPLMLNRWLFLHYIEISNRSCFIRFKII